jgi:lipoprotein NlpD
VVVLQAICLLVLSACSSKPGLRAPVEDRGRSANSAQTSTAAAAAPTLDVSKTAATAVVDPNAGKPGYYTVKQGDTLIRIGLESGQSHRDIARWNALDNPNRIEIGQVLRVVPPEEAVVTKPVAAPNVTSSVLASAGAAPAPPAGRGVPLPRPPPPQAVAGRGSAGPRGALTAKPRAAYPRLSLPPPASAAWCRRLNSSTLDFIANLSFEHTVCKHRMSSTPPLHRVPEES